MVFQLVNAITHRFTQLPAHLKRRESIVRFEQALAKLPQVQLKIEHHFSEGLYARTIFIPAGCALVGEIHKLAGLTIMQYGDIIIASEGGTKRLIGPCTFHTPAGMKRAGWAQKDTLWTGIYANPHNERDIDTLDRMLIAESYDAIPPPAEVIVIEADHARLD